MKLNQRQKDLVELVNLKQRVSVRTLARTLYFSEMTVRRDLMKLEGAGYLRRYHGGALALTDAEQHPLEQRMHINEKEKRGMAKSAERYLCDGQTVFLPGCSTCAYLLPLLKSFKNLHVITNSVSFLRVLSEMQVQCTLCGGEYYAADKILIGRVAEGFLRSVNYDIAFLSCDGIDEDGAVSVLREDAAALFSICRQNARRIVLIADHSKLSSRCKYRVCHTDDVDEVIVL